MRKKVVIVVGVIIVLILGYVIYKKVTYKPPVVEQAITSDEPEVISASGTIRAEKTVTLTFQTGGKLAWLGVAEGDSVKKWQALANLDTYEVERNLKNSLIAYSKQRATFEETRTVTYKDQTVNNPVNDTVKRLLEKNQWDLEKAVNDVEITHDVLKLSTLISPIDGIVTSVSPKVAGVNVNTTTASITVADPLSIEFVAEVDEIDVVNIKEGQKAIITLDSKPDDKIETTVKKIAFSSVVTSTGGTAYEVTFSLPANDNLQFRIGMNGDVEFQ